MQQGAADGGLAAAGLTHQAQGLAPLDAEGDTVHGLQRLGMEAVDLNGKVFLQILYLNQRRVMHGVTHFAAPPF